MINIKNTTALFCLFAIGFSSAFAGSALEINGVKVLDKNSINVEFNNKTLEFSPESEVKIYKDLKVKELGLNDKKLVIELDEKDFLSGYYYSLISLGGLDLNIDFFIDNEKRSLVNVENKVWSNLSFIDDKTIHIDLVDGGNTPNLKLLKELKTSGIKSNSGDLNIELSDDLENSNSYILMFLSLKDTNEKYIDLENSLYDFTVNNLEEESSELSEEKQELSEEIQDYEYELVVIDELDDNLNISMEDEVELSHDLTDVLENENELLDDKILTSASVDDENLDNTNEEYVDIEDIAMQAQTTPDTGTKEIFIVLLSLLLGIGYFVLSTKKA